MLAVRTPGAPQTARVVAACGSAFPFERQGRLLRSRSISGLYSRSLHSGLQPPCLRFAAAVTGRHARLGSRLLARLYRGRHRRRQTSTRLQGATLTEPDLILSHHPARATAGKLPPSAEVLGSSPCQMAQVGPFRLQWPAPFAPRALHPLHRYYRTVRPCPTHRYFSASRLLPLVPFPLASPSRFSRSM